MPTDILHRTDNGDIDLTGGDIKLGESTKQHQRDILLARKYDYRTAPGVGAASEDFIGDQTEDYLREVRIQFAKDGMAVESLALVDGNLKTEASYEDS